MYQPPSMEVQTHLSPGKKEKKERKKKKQKKKKIEKKKN